MKKSYLVGILMAVLAGLRAAGIVSDVLYDAILALLAGAGITTMRAAVSKNGSGQ